MEIIKFVLHVNDYLKLIIDWFGPYTYLILFTIIFCETGLVVTPFLPGDSLLFAVGALAGGGFLNIWAAYLLLLAAAILGDSSNYWLGRHFGPKVFSKESSRFFNPAYLEKTRQFYAKHGKKATIIARFVPIIRTFAPFVAGVGKMHYGTFLLYSIGGGFAWVTLFTWLGYFFGGIPFVKKNFELAVVLIILVSVVPILVEFIRHKKESKKTTSFTNVKKTLQRKHLND